MLSEGPWKRTNIRLIGVDVGPGSFTGVRVGLAVARTLAQGLKVPLVGISSLEAMARAVAEKLSQKNYSSSPRKPIGQDEGVVQSVFKYDLQHSSKVLVPWFPATAGEVYFAVYKNGRVVVAPCWRSEADMRNILRRFPDHVITTEPASSQVIAELAIEKYLKKPSSKKFHFENVVPQYLQPSWAERSKRSR
ncbi:MAG: hypothetical protein KCHDKBKB_02126 [Elusimicrobia bacterium]|nr:hypothetical protein [Elusimicrobiota bacterium]